MKYAIDKTAHVPVRMRSMVFSADCGDVGRIDAEAFENPWCMNAHISYTTDPCARCWVALDNSGSLVGFVYAYLRVDSITIERIAVDQKYAMCGIGRQMITRILGMLRPRGYGRRHACFAAVEDTNLPAHLFFKSCGFTASEVIKDYYKVNEDAYLFEFQHQQKDLPC